MLSQKRKYQVVKSRTVIAECANILIYLVRVYSFNIKARDE